MLIDGSCRGMGHCLGYTQQPISSKTLAGACGSSGMRVTLLYSSRPTLRLLQPFLSAGLYLGSSMSQPRLNRPEKSIRHQPPRNECHRHLHLHLHLLLRLRIFRCSAKRAQNCASTPEYRGACRRGLWHRCDFLSKLCVRGHVQATSINPYHTHTPPHDAEAPRAPPGTVHCGETIMILASSTIEASCP